MFLGYTLLNFAYYIVDLFETLITRCSKSTSICGNEKRDGLHNKTSILYGKGKIFEESSKEMEEMRKSIDDMDSRLRMMEGKLHKALQNVTEKIAQKDMCEPQNVIFNIVCKC